MRSLFVGHDSLGHDALRDAVLDGLSQIRNYNEYVVKENEAYNPQLIAFREYGRVDMYYLLLHYNGLNSGFDMHAGQTLKIPDRIEVMRLFSPANRSTVRTVRI